jgi:hypothetical protein
MFEHFKVQFIPGEFLIHKPTFSGDLDNYDIWCVLDDQYLQKYEPVLLTTGERCHQSADVLAQYTPNRQEFFLVKVEEKGKTENNNIVVSILSEYDPKTNPKIASALLAPIVTTDKHPKEDAVSSSVPTAQSHTASSEDMAMSSTTSNNNNNVVSNEIAEIVDVSSSMPIINDEPSVSLSSTNLLSKYDDCKNSFDIFVQVLSSQCLNVEFLVKIREIQDEYFKPSLEFIENLLLEKYDLVHGMLVQKLLVQLNSKLVQKLAGSSATKLVDVNPNVRFLVDNRPRMLLVNSSMNHLIDEGATKWKACGGLSYDLSVEDNFAVLGDELALFNGCLNVKFDGDLYNPDTLLSTGQDEGLDGKEFCLSERIYKFFSLMHSLKHFKYHLYEQCAQKVSFQSFCSH